MKACHKCGTFAPIAELRDKGGIFECFSLYDCVRRQRMASGSAVSEQAQLDALTTPCEPVVGNAMLSAALADRIGCELGTIQGMHNSVKHNGADCRAFAVEVVAFVAHLFNIAPSELEAVRLRMVAHMKVCDCGGGRRRP